MAAGADEHRRGDPVVDDPGVAFSAEARERDAHLEARARAIEQIVIELATADAEADRTTVARFDVVRAADESGSKAGDWLEGASAAIVVDVEFRSRYDLWGNPACARLVARKHGAIDDDHVEAGLTKLPRARRAGRSTPDDEHVAGIHRVTRAPTSRGGFRRERRRSERAASSPS